MRELRNLMERAAILVPGDEVTAGDIAPWLEGSPGRAEGAGLRGEIERREGDAIRRALERGGLERHPGRGRAWGSTAPTCTARCASTASSRR